VLSERCAALADRWRRALARTIYVPFSAGELREAFLALAAAVHAALVEGVDLAQAGRQIGSSLVSMGYTASDSLGTTLKILAEDVAQGLSVDDARALQPRLATLLGGVGAGFATAARERLLVEQEATRTAVLAENRRAGEAIRRQAALLELAPDAILVRTMDGHVVFWNRGAETLYGWARDEATGRIVHELLRTRFPRPLPELQAELLQHGFWEGELVHTRRDGSTLIVSSRWAVQAANGEQPQSVLEINTDITTRKQMEATLREREASLETAQSLAHLGSWEMDLQTGATYWSPVQGQLVHHRTPHAWSRWHSPGGAVTEQFRRRRRGAHHPPVRNHSRHHRPQTGRGRTHAAAD
jgi:PAS domain S-box-containing protein